jgi:hypothetical protein
MALSQHLPHMFLLFAVFLNGDKERHLILVLRVQCESCHPSPPLNTILLVGITSSWSNYWYTQTWLPHVHCDTYLHLP